MIDGHFFKLKNDLYAFIKDKIFEELKQNKYDFIKSIIEKAEQISYECIQASKNINKDLSFWQFLEYFDIMHRLRFPWTSLFPIDEAATEYIQEYARKNSLDFDDIFASLPQLTNSISEDQKMLLQFQYEIKKENLQFSIEYIQAKKPALSIRIQDYQIETEYLGTHHMWGEGRTILKLMQAIETAHENNKIPSAPKHFDLEILAIMAEA